MVLWEGPLALCVPAPMVVVSVSVVWGFLPVCKVATGAGVVGSSLDAGSAVLTAGNDGRVLLVDVRRCESDGGAVEDMLPPPDPATKKKKAKRKAKKNKKGVVGAGVGGPGVGAGTGSKGTLGCEDGDEDGEEDGEGGSGGGSGGGGASGGPGVLSTGGLPPGAGGGPPPSRVVFAIDHGCGPNSVCTGTACGGYVAVASPEPDIVVYYGLCRA